KVKICVPQILDDNAFCYEPTSPLGVASYAFGSPPLGSVDSFYVLFSAPLLSGQSNIHRKKHRIFPMFFVF
ncbi:MAG: hypothetical protein J6K51_02835, partial [Clostridia bacterium]|nr:hypothetical protein [Clostridia bacterium]